MRISDVSAHGSTPWPHEPNLLFLQMVNHEVFSLTWAKSTIYLAGASGLLKPKRLYLFCMLF